MMHNLLLAKGIDLSGTTCHKYMNGELGLYSVTRKHKPGYHRGAAHKVFENLLNRNFTAEKPDKIWCTDFTYIPLKNGSMRYNCTIIDLYDRSVIASACGRNITAELAIKTTETFGLIRDPAKFCVKLNKALPIRQDLRQGKN